MNIFLIVKLWRNKFGSNKSLIAKWHLVEQLTEACADKDRQKPQPYLLFLCLRSHTQGYPHYSSDLPSQLPPPLNTPTERWVTRNGSWDQALPFPLPLPLPLLPDMRILPMVVPFPSPKTSLALHMSEWVIRLWIIITRFGVMFWYPKTLRGRDLQT